MQTQMNGYSSGIKRSLRIYYRQGRPSPKGNDAFPSVSDVSPISEFFSDSMVDL